MIEAIMAILALFSGGIFLAHAVNTYRAAERRQVVRSVSLHRV